MRDVFPDHRVWGHTVGVCIQARVKEIEGRTALMHSDSFNFRWGRTDVFPVPQQLDYATDVKSSSCERLPALWSCREIVAGKTSIELKIVARSVVILTQINLFLGTARIATCHKDGGRVR